MRFRSLLLPSASLTPRRAGRSGTLVAVTALAAVTLAACTASASPESTSTEPAADAMQLPEGTTVPLTVPQQTGAAPHEFLDDNNDLVGTAVDVTNEIGKILGYPVTNVQTTFEDSFIGLDSKKYTWIPSADVTAVRQEKYDMVLIGKDAIGLQVLSDSPDIGNDMMDICGVNIGLINSQSSISTLEEQSAKCEAAGEEPVTISTFTDTPQVTLALKSGQIDAQIANVSVAAYQQKIDPDAFKVTGPSFDQIYQAILLEKGSPLAPLLRDAVNELIENGTYAAIHEKYGAEEMIIEESVINPDPITGEAGEQ